MEILYYLYRAVQEGNNSTIGYAKMKGPTNSRKVRKALYRATSIMKKGVEDPRVVKIEETYYVTYTAYDGINVMGALATSKDLIHFENME
jgi:predicted GH43/DUF377 family glycosyl hydrolase